MSLKTWEAEFVEDFETDPVKILERDLKKWIGLRPENLKKHGVETTLGGSLADTHEVFFIDGTTCNSCLASRDKCCNCDLCKCNGNIPCDKGSDGGISRFAAWSLYNDPEPMITLIEKAIKRS